MRIEKSRPYDDQDRVVGFILESLILLVMIVGFLFVLNKLDNIEAKMKAAPCAQTR